MGFIITSSARVRGLIDIMTNIRKAANKARIPSTRKRAFLYAVNGDLPIWMSRTDGSKTNKKAAYAHRPSVKMLTICL
jgi:hypothetical protein